MKRLMLVFVASMPLICLAQSYQIDWYVIGSGGGHSESGSYQVDGTIGQPVVGQTSSSNYIVEAGFWVGAAGPGGCAYVVGDWNGSGTWTGQDVGSLLNYLKYKSLPPAIVTCLPCSTLGLNMYWPAGDANGSCTVNGNDITWMVNHFKYWRAPDWPYPGTPCPQCLPAGLAPPVSTIEPVKAPMPRMREKIKSKDL